MAVPGRRPAPCPAAKTETLFPEQRGDHRLEGESTDESVECVDHVEISMGIIVVVALLACAWAILEPACHERSRIERRREVADAHAELLGRWIDTVTQRAELQKRADFEGVPHWLIFDGGVERAHVDGVVRRA